MILWCPWMSSQNVIYIHPNVMWDYRLTLPFLQPKQFHAEGEAHQTTPFLLQPEWPGLGSGGPGLQSQLVRREHKLLMQIFENVLKNVNVVNCWLLLSGENNLTKKLLRAPQTIFDGRCRKRRGRDWKWRCWHFLYTGKTQLGHTIYTALYMYCTEQHKWWVVVNLLQILYL